MVSSDGLSFHSLNSLRLSLISARSRSESHGGLEVRLRTYLDGTNFSAQSRKVFFQFVQSLSTLSVFPSFGQACCSNASLNDGMLAFAVFHSRRGAVLFFLVEWRSSEKAIEKWSDEPTGGSTLRLDIEVGEFVMTRSSRDPGFWGQ